MKERVYIRAIGENRFRAGTYRWLRVRNIERPKNGVYELCVHFKGREMRTVVSDNKIPDLEFKIGYWPKALPADFSDVLRYWEGKDLWTL